MRLLPLAFSSQDTQRKIPLRANEHVNRLLFVSKPLSSVANRQQVHTVSLKDICIINSCLLSPNHSSFAKWFTLWQRRVEHTNGLQLLPPLWPLRSLRGQALSRRLAIGQWREVAGQSSPKLNSPRNIHADLPLIAAIPLKNELIDLKMLPSVCSCEVFYCMTVLKKLIALILVLFWQDRGVRVTYGWGAKLQEGWRRRTEGKLMWEIKKWNNGTALHGLFHPPKINSDALFYCWCRWEAPWV